MSRSPSEQPSPLALVRDFTADLWRFTRGSRAAVLLLVAAGSMLESVGLVLLIPLLSIVFGSGSRGGAFSKVTARFLSALPATTVSGRLFIMLMMFAALVALRGIVLVKRDTLLTRLQTQFVNSKRLRIIELLMRSRWEVITRLRHGRVVNILGNDVYNLRSAAHFVVQSAVALVMLMSQIALAFLISPVIAVLVLLLLLVAAIFTRRLLSSARELGAEVAQSNVRLTSSTTEFLNALKILLSQNLQGRFESGFRDASAWAAEREVAFARQRAISQAALTGCAAAVGICVLLVAVPWLRSPPSALLALLVIMSRMSAPAMQIQQGAQQVANSLPAYLQLKTLEAELEEGVQFVTVVPETSEIRRFAGPKDIEFCNVTYVHAGGSGGLRNLSLRIPKGVVLGVTGPSGAGKTTFADLLVGLLAPQSGAILVDGRELAGSHLQAWRESVSYVSQDPFLHHASVRENVLWANAAASEEDMWRALHLAGADQMVMELPNGPATIVGERGCMLSGGERQRVALAGALLRRPSLLLLDEATNAVDIESENFILHHLKTLDERPSIVMIAHRASSLAICDEIMQFSIGHVNKSQEIFAVG